MDYNSGPLIVTQYNNVRVDQIVSCEIYYKFLT